MSDQPRDWDRELAEIDKVIARSPVQPPAQSGEPPGPPVRGGGTAATGGRLATLTTWVRTVLGLALAVGMTQWPYPNACGLNLAIYLGAISTVVVATDGCWIV